MISVKLSKDMRKMDAMELSVPLKVGYVVSDAAIALRDDIRGSWSPESPSSPGMSPAVLSGNLDSAIFVDDTGRDAGGHFASDTDAIMHYVRIDTTKGDEYQGRGGYEGYLEEGTANMDARPFIEPAVERLEAVFPGFFGDIFS